MSEIEFIIKRNGEKVQFDKKLILRAIENAFKSDNSNDLAAVATLTDEVVNDIISRFGTNPIAHVEVVQDIVEEVLMKNGHHRIAKNYILYREEHKIQRQEDVLSKIKDQQLTIQGEDQEAAVFNPQIIAEILEKTSADLGKISVQELVANVSKQIYDNITKKEIDLLVLAGAKERIEQHYEYAYLASRLVLNKLYKEIIGESFYSDSNSEMYQSGFSDYISKGISLEMLNPELKSFDLDKLSNAIQSDRDKKFRYLGMQILVDRYLLRDRSSDRCIFELPQWFWMRVAMGLSLLEEHKEDRAIEFYNVLSAMDLVSSTPTLFNSGTLHSQMSSCYINISGDSLTSIFKLYSDSASLSKWAGGIGTDWTPVRATGSKIKGTNGASQGVIPFIKIFNDVALAVNQGGKRKGAMCAYMEVWHLDYEQFLELKKNTGDERRRAHDINTASWIPDLFMKRVKENGKWTMFCPSDVPDLHDLYGEKFEERYRHYESLSLPRAKTINALDLWRKMLTMLYETGHPWITFKDAINIRSPQDHVGCIHSSNLCTEITLNTSKEETAVCNLASINLANMVTDGRLDEAKLAKTVRTGMRMLDNVIDNNFYPTPEAKKANLRHRAVGLGMMGYQDALYKMNMRFDSDANLAFADRSMEMISYYAISGSCDLAEERGSYESYEGSKWSRSIFPYDTLALLEQNRGIELKVDRVSRMDWKGLKTRVRQHGMRNSNTMAIAPTATIANIVGVYPCTEPAFKNLYMKENLSGNFVVINEHLMKDLERTNLWNENMLAQIKFHNGSLAKILDIPEDVREKYKETFEIESSWIIRAAALRAKWIDQSASTNIFVKTTSGKLLNDIYMMAWEYGLKTTYYLRSLGATQVQKATVGDNVSENVPGKPVVHATVGAVTIQESTDTVPLCKINDPTCEACE